MMTNRVLAPPYTPGFGRRPPVLAGRDALVDDLARVLEVGPEHPRFCRALLGSRGTGKTVLLDVIGEVAATKLGWAVLHVQALQEESLVALLLQRIPEAVRLWGRFGRGSNNLQAQLRASTGSAAAAFENAVGLVGGFAARHGTGLLLTVDEAQMAAPEDLSAVARALQTVVARRLQPVAVVFSGLPTFRERLAGAGTYASRLPVEELGNLEPSAARLALVEPAARRHVAWEDDALSLLVRRSGGHPYYVQLFGWHAWEVAQGEATITLAHAKAGLAAARAELAGQYEVTWGRLRPQERDYLAAVASLAGAGGAGVEEVAKVLGKEPKQLAVARDRLVHKHELLEVPGRARSASSTPRWPRGWRSVPTALRLRRLCRGARRPRPVRAVAGPPIRPLRTCIGPDAAGRAPSGPGTWGADAAGSWHVDSVGSSGPDSALPPVRHY